MTTFWIHLIDGEVYATEDNAEGFLVRWQESVEAPDRQWPYAYLEPKAFFVNGEQVKANRRVVHFNPTCITAVEVEMDE